MYSRSGDRCEREMQGAHKLYRRGSHSTKCTNDATTRLKREKHGRGKGADKNGSIHENVITHFQMPVPHKVQELLLMQSVQ